MGISALVLQAQEVATAPPTVPAGSGLLGCLSQLATYHLVCFRPFSPDPSLAETD